MFYRNTVNEFKLVQPS